MIIWFVNSCQNSNNHEILAKVPNKTIEFLYWKFNLYEWKLEHDKIIVIRIMCYVLLIKIE